MLSSMCSTTLVTVLATLTSLTSAHYTLTDGGDLSLHNFFDNFDLFSEADPTNGFVAYQDQESAIKNELIGYLENSVYLGVDWENVTPAGRPSVRAESKKSWNKGLLLVDLKHMPSSECGLWPAFWMLGNGTWPEKGEIDILEGVNDNNHNAVTLHTTAGCVVDNSTTGSQGMADASAAFSGNMVTENCDVQAANQDKNQGCSIAAPSHSGSDVLPSYGTEFNNVGGGVYAMEWTSTSISVWFFPRGSPNISTIAPSLPNATKATDYHPDPKTFGTPMAHFAGSGCDFEARFQDLRIIFDTTFCGEWAGRQEVWDSSCKAKTGAATCIDYVRDNPHAFEEAYWEINGLWWYENKELEKRALTSPHQRGRTYKW